MTTATASTDVSGIVSAAEALRSAAAGRGWIADGLSPDKGMAALDATMRPIDALSSAGLDWLTPRVQPLQNVLDSMAGSSSVVQSFAAAGQRAAQSVDDVQRQLAGRARADTQSWQGKAGDGYRSVAAQTGAALQATAALHTATSTMSTLLGGVVADARTQVNDLLTDLVQRLISYVRIAGAAEGGGPSPDTMAQATSMINAYAVPIADIERKLLQTIGGPEAQVAAGGSGDPLQSAVYHPNAPAQLVPAFVPPAVVGAALLLWRIFTMLKTLYRFFQWLDEQTTTPDVGPQTARPPQIPPPAGTPPQPETTPQSAPEQPTTPPANTPPPTTPSQAPQQAPPTHLSGDEPPAKDEPAPDPKPEPPAEPTPDTPPSEKRELTDDEKWRQMEEAAGKQDAPAPAPSDGRVQRYKTPEDAIGEEVAGKKLAILEVTKADNEGLREQGFTEKWYMYDPDHPDFPNDPQYSVHHDPKTGDFAVGKRSSSND